jgi:YVTN family beta-propeller protein
VLAIDGATNQKIARIPAGLGVRVLGYNSTNNKIYCANYYDGNVTVVDGATNLVITTVPAVVQGPRAFCYNPTNNKVYFANGNWDGVTVIDGVTDSVTATVAVSGDVGQLGLACNPARNRVYVANCYGSCISVLSDSGLTGVDDALRPASRSKPLPTIVRGVLCLADDRGPGTGDLSALMDACGRKVLDLRPSANDVRALAPGVYFVRDAQAQAQVQAIRKIVITR